MNELEQIQSDTEIRIARNKKKAELNSEVMAAAKAVATRTKEIRLAARSGVCDDRESLNVFGSRLEELDFRERYMTFDDKWS